MSVSLTFHFDSLQEANDFMVAAEKTKSPEVQKSPSSVRTVAELKAAAKDVEAWWKHLGKKSKEFWVIAATHMLDSDSFTFEELESENISQGSLKSRHRNSYRAIKHEKAKEPLDQEWSWEIGKNIYVIGQPIRDRILELAQLEETTNA